MQCDRRNFLRASARLAIIPLLAPLFKGVASATGASIVDQGSADTAMASGSSLPLIDPVMATRIKAISNVFEVGSPEPDYAYVENLGDGRGYTVTQYGFCTYNGEVTWVINRHAQDVPDTPLKRFLPFLPPLTSGAGTAGSRGISASVESRNQGVKASCSRLRRGGRPALPLPGHGGGKGRRYPQPDRLFHIL